jgi:hypothetical protein
VVDAYGGKAGIEAGCTGNGGVVVSACASDSRVGLCTLTLAVSAGTATQAYSFYSPTYTQATASAECATRGGTFTRS